MSPTPETGGRSSEGRRHAHHPLRTAALRGDRDDPDGALIPVDDAAIRTLVERLSRSHRSGGRVIERASILAEGEGAADVIAWIAEHGGTPESAAPPRSGGGGVHGDHFHDRGRAVAPVARRWILPADALSPPAAE